MLATSVGGRKTTAAIEKILMILFCSRLMNPIVASIRNLIFSKTNPEWLVSDSMSRSAPLMALALDVAPTT